MLRPLRWAVLSSSVAIGLARAAFDARPLVTVYSVEDIGQDALSWTTVEDAQHGLHFGANSLISFDGSRWRSDPAANAYEVRGLDVDPSGRIWAAANGQIGWFERSGDAAWEFHSLVGRLDQADRHLGEMWQVFRLPGGAVFGGANALYWWNGTAFTVQRFPDPRRIPLLRTSAGGIYVSQSASGLWKVSPTARARVLPIDQLAGGAVLWLEEAPGSGTMLLATTRGFFSGSGGKARPVYPEASELVRKLGLTAALRLADGRLAVATLRGGILLLNRAGEVVDRFGRSEGLPTDEVFSLHADREGGLWATSSANIFRVSLTASRWFRQPDGTGDEPCVAFARTNSGLLLATDTALFRTGDSEDRLTALPGIARHWWTLESAGDQVLLGRNGGMDRWSGDRIEPVYQGRADVTAIKVGADHQTAIIAAGPELLQVALRSFAAAVVATVPEAPSTLALGPAGEVWVGTTTQGIFHGTLRPNAVPALQPSGFSPNRGPGIVASDPEGLVYAFVDRQGWRVGAKGAAEQIRDFPPREVAAAETGPAGTWIVHAPAEGLGAALAEIRAGTDGPQWVPRLVEGLWRVGIPESLHAERQGDRIRLWVGGSAGLFRCELIAGAAPVTLPSARLTVRRRDGTVIPDRGRLPYSAGEVLVSATADSYALRPALTLETKIDPVDREWTPLEAAGTRRLAALRDGKYDLRARVRASTGQVSAESSQALTVLAPWWRTGWASAAFVLLLAGAGYGLHRWNSRALRRRAERLERAVQGRTREVEQANAEKTRFVAGISHDIRNPLNGIVGLTLALEDSVLDARQRELTAAMRGCAKYLDGLVDEVLDFAQIEAGHAALQPEWYQVAELLQDVIGITRTDAEVAGATIGTEVASGVPAQLWGDVSRVRQILVNLTFNAIRHAGGAIVLGARQAATDTGRMIEYSVADRGPGIAAQDQPRLFEPFSRIESADRRRSVRGSGLGLATSKRWAEAMGGKILVVSAAGQGSRFTLALPWPEEPPPPSASTARVALRRVLIVEDEDYNAWAIAAVAARVGVTVTARASTGAEALRLFAPGRFDGILLDRLLPDMDGTKVCRAVRMTGDDRVKIIALTAGATAEDRAACFAAGMDAFIGKPLTPEKLVAVLKQLEEGSAAPPVAPEPAPRPAAPPFDLRLLAYLSDGSSVGQEREHERYLLTLDDAHTALRLAIAAEDLPAIRECAHRLHGHLRMIEAGEAGPVVAQIELAAQRGEMPPPEWISRAGGAIERLRTALTPGGGQRQNRERGRNAAAPDAN